MLFKDIKQKVIKSLKDKKANVHIQLIFNDELGKKYKYGEISLIQFIEQITENLPYTITETNGENYIIHEKTSKLPINMFIDPKNFNKIFDKDIEEKFVKAYPELKEMYLSSKQEVNKAGCSNCAKNSKTMQIVNEFLYLSHKNRQNEFLKDLYGEKFYEVLLESEPQKRPKINPTLPKIQNKDVPQTSQDKNSVIVNKPTIENGPRKSCPNCCLKHISNAIVLLNESKMGYPSHRWLAIGHLDQASEEILRDHPDIANEIRNIRLKLMEDNTKIPLLMNLLEDLDKKFNPQVY